VIPQLHKFLIFGSFRQSKNQATEFGSFSGCISNFTLNNKPLRKPQIVLSHKLGTVCHCQPAVENTNCSSSSNFETRYRDDDVEFEDDDETLPLMSDALNPKDNEMTGVNLESSPAQISVDEGGAKILEMKHFKPLKLGTTDDENGEILFRIVEKPKNGRLLILFDDENQIKPSTTLDQFSSQVNFQCFNVKS